MRPFTATPALLYTASAVALAAAVAFAGGCADDAGAADPTLTQSDYDDVATTVGALHAGDGRGDLHVVIDSIAAFDAQLPPWLTHVEGELTGFQGGLSYRFTITCEDGFGALVSCGPAAARANVTATLEGHWDGARVSTEGAWSGHWTLTRLDDGSVLVDGVASADVTTEIQRGNHGALHRWEIDYQVAFDGLVVDETHTAVDGAASYYLSVVRDLDLPNGKTVTKGFVVDADVLFDGSGDAQLILDGRYRYHVVTATGATTAD